jgi:hypothetical protein
MNPRSKKTVGVLAVLSAVAVAGVLMSPAGAHVTGRFRHLWRIHIKPKLAAPGLINDSRNPVDWTRLKNVPAGLADGTDDTAAGGGGGGAPGIVGYEVVSVTEPESSINVKGRAVECPAGKVAVGGGVKTSGPATAQDVLAVESSFPFSDGTAWHAIVHEQPLTDAVWKLEVFVVCATRAP